VLKAEVAHTLRMLELIRRTDIPVAAGAEYPLSAASRNRNVGATLWYGPRLGAWTPKLYHPADDLGPCPKASQPSKPSTRMPRTSWSAWCASYPHEVTIYAGGPMTNLALAISIDPEFLL